MTKNPNILILVDQTAIVLAVRKALVGVAARLHEAGLDVLAEDFALILMDLQMPGFDDICTRLRSNLTTADIPIIFLGKPVALDCMPQVCDFLELSTLDHCLKARVQLYLKLYQQQRLLQEYHRSFRVAAAIFESREGMLVCDANIRILRVNSAFTRLTGYSSAEVLGRNPKMLGSGKHSAEFYSAMWQEILDQGNWEGEIWNRHKDGAIYPLRLGIAVVKDQHSQCTHFIGTLVDIAASLAAEDEIKQLAFYDSLTHLPNRRLLLDRLKQAMASSTRSGSMGALLIIDLDNFKTLNDTLGHAIGDLLLQQVAIRLEYCIREGDTVARLGGDEFVVMLEDLSFQSLDAAAQAEAVCMKILFSLNQPYRLEQIDHLSTPSIGVVLFKGHEQTPDELLRQADIAMYQAKNTGRNTLRFFDPKMQDVLNASAALEMDLRHAISEQEQFVLYYQPQVDISDCLIGAEVLLRWHHPKRGVVSPCDFIPLAEESGLILPLGHWVLATVCLQLLVWAEQPEKRHLTLAVNISAKQFHLPTFVEEVLTLVDHFAINPSRLKLEITESMLLNNVDSIITKMLRLKARGISFSMDDFGTGYSSLQYLKRLPLDQLKIDQSFVRDIVADSNDKAIVRTIIAMAKSMDMDVIAEGVETQQQRQLLISKGCSAFQGYLFGRPVPIEQFDRLF